MWDLRFVEKARLLKLQNEDLCLNALLEGVGTGKSKDSSFQRVGRNCKTKISA